MNQCVIVTGVLRIQRRTSDLISACTVTYFVLLHLQVLKSKHYPVFVEMFDQFKFRLASFTAYF